MSSLLPVPWFARRHLHRRLTQIASVLTRHGMGWLLAQTGLAGYASRHHGLLSRVIGDSSYTQAEHLRMALGELGGAFIKLGQVLSTRSDLIPHDYVVELAKLQDAAPAVDITHIRQVILEELGASPEVLFAEFDPEPAASASIGQAHSARLKDGRQVIVKVRRPGIAAQVEQDLEILFGMVGWAEANTEFGEYYNLMGMVEEFAFTIRNELDYRREGANADRFRRNFAGDDGIYIPEVIWKLTTGRVLTMEKVGGIKVNDIARLEAEGIDRKAVAENSVRLMLREVFEFGFFHADPHPGNFFVRPDTSIALIDFGMVGHLSNHLQEALLRLGLAAVRRDAEAMVDEYYNLGVAGSRAKRSVLERDLDHYLSRYAGGSIKDLAAAEATADLMEMAYRHRLQLPSELVMLFRVISVSENLGATLDPDFRLQDFAAPYLREFWLERRSPRATLARLSQAVLEVGDLTLDLPHRASRLLNEVERGEISFRVRSEDLPRQVTHLQKALNRLALAVLLAGGMVFLGLSIVAYRPPEWAAYALWFIVAGLLFSFAFGIWLFWSTWRSGST